VCVSVCVCVSLCLGLNALHLRPHISDHSLTHTLSLSHSHTHTHGTGPWKKTDAVLERIRCLKELSLKEKCILEQVCVCVCVCKNFLWCVSLCSGQNCWPKYD